MAACSTPDTAVQFHDPYEAQNRKFHAFNKSVDRTVLRPASKAYGAATPTPIKRGLSNFASNASLPSKFVNASLQGDIEGAGRNFFRFLINTTFGIGGLLDVAGNDIPEEDADFGETLAVWGAKEGAYLELPLLGPSTERDAAGRIVDFFTNPLRGALNDETSQTLSVARTGSTLGNRDTFGSTIDATLYESADSYAQLRLFYLQNRRFELGEAAAEIDPYEDPFDDPLFTE